MDGSRDAFRSWSSGNRSDQNEAAAVLKATGLTVSDAFGLMMVKIANEKSVAQSLMSQ